MPIYKASGEEIQVGADYALKINPTDNKLYWYENGVPTGQGVDVGHFSIDVSDVISFYQQPLKNAAYYVKRLGKKYVSYLLVADQHYTLNYGYTPQLMECLYASGLFDKMLFLGDNLESFTEARKTAWLSAHENLLPYSLVLMGNHERSSGTERYEWFKENVFDVMASCSFGGEEHSYYYYDNSTFKIRLIMLDPPRDRSNQKVWLKSVIASVPSDWTYFVLSHEPQDAFVTSYGTYPLTRVLDEDYGAYCAMDNRFGGLMCGHRHSDISNLKYGFLHNDCFLSDSYKSSGLTPEAPAPPRSKADATAQSITIVSINPTTKNVKFYRIGQVDTSTVTWVNKKREYTYGTRLPVVLDDIWTGIDGTMQVSAGAKLWMQPQEVDPTQTYYIFHQDGTDLDADRSNYHFFEYDENGNFLGRSGNNTVVDAKIHRANIRNNTKYVIKSARGGDEYVLSNELPN